MLPGYSHRLSALGSQANNPRSHALCLMSVHDKDKDEEEEEEEPAAAVVVAEAEAAAAVEVLPSSSPVSEGGLLPKASTCNR